ncbi:caspase family protein [Chloroflexi bacterium TSY]|nr:caspase family protein [Chloroflexi bacterium TSY]
MFWIGPKQDDIVLIYFSGHGVKTPAYHLLPNDYDLTNLVETAIAGSLFTEKLRAIQAKILLVLLDCCHAGGQAEAKGVLKSSLPLSAFDEFQKSSGLAGYGAFEQDGYARIIDTAMWISRKVPERTNDKQHPILKLHNLADNFAIAWYGGGGKAVNPLNWIVDTPNANLAVDATQVAAWKRMLTNYRDNLLLIEERMSEYVEYNETLLSGKRKEMR